MKKLRKDELKILDILGFDEKESELSEFLEKIIKNFDDSQLSDLGISLFSIKQILKKINPDHRIFILEKEKEFLDQETLDLLLGAGGLE